MNTASCAAVGVVLLVLMPANGRAQTTEPPLRRLELAAGIVFLGGASLGDADADLRSSTPPDPYRLFATSSRVLGTTAAGPARGVRSFASVRARGACAVRPSGGAHDRGERRRGRSHHRSGRAARSLSDRRGHHRQAGRAPCEGNPAVCHRRRRLSSPASRRADGDRRGTGVLRRCRRPLLDLRARPAGCPGPAVCEPTSGGTF